MSREVNRVPLDFGWPLDEVWQGYLMPEALRENLCPACRRRSPRDGSDGLTPEARAIADTFYPHMVGGAHAETLAWHDKIGQAEVDMLVEAGRLREWQGPERRWVRVPRTAEDVNNANHGWASSLGVLGHDGINRLLLVRFRCERLGIRYDCPTCDGRTTVEAYRGQRAEAEAWQPTEPPEGEGWQLWETVSEGSPISPVFATAEELAQWLTTRAACWGAMRSPMTIEQARGFVGVGGAPSMVGNAGGLHDGATFVGTDAAFGDET